MGMTREQLLQLEKEALIDLLLVALARIGELEQQVVQQNERLQKLESSLAKISRISGKPPSSDGPKKPKTRSLRRPSGRNQGGQKVHKGHTLEMVAEPHYREVVTVTTCPHCAYDLSQAPVIGHEKRQLFDLPPIELEVTEYLSFFGR